MFFWVLNSYAMHKKETNLVGQMRITMERHNCHLTLNI